MIFQKTCTDCYEPYRTLDRDAHRCRLCLTERVVIKHAQSFLSDIYTEDSIDTIDAPFTYDHERSGDRLHFFSGWGHTRVVRPAFDVDMYVIINPTR